jgi:drug/metabolite transporter (DMT)-like permease
VRFGGQFLYHRRGFRHFGRAGDVLTPQEKAQKDRLTGIALMCGAVLLFACSDASAKYLNGHMATVQVVWARYMSAFVLALFMFNPIKQPQVMRTGRPWLQLGRSTLLFVSTALNFVALRYLQLDQAVAIIFCTPFIVAALGGPMLGEWIHWRRWTAIGVGFCGVLLVTRPGAGGIHPAALLSVMGAFCYAIYSIATRILARTDSTATTNFYSNLVGAILVSIAVPFFWTSQSDPIVIVLMCIMGLFSGTGHYLLIRGHRLAPASVLAPFIYTEIVWMIALGYWVFGDVPNHWTLAGVAVVILSGLYLLYRERVAGVKGDV